MRPAPVTPAPPGPYDLPTGPAMPPRRTRTGLLALVAGVTVVLVIGVFVVVMAARPHHHGTPVIAASDAGLRGDATATPGVAAPEHAANAASVSASPTLRTTASAPAHNGATSGIASDEFSGTSLDSTRWSVYGGDGSVYSPNAVRVSGGELQVLGIGRNPTAAANQAGGVCWCRTAGDHVYGTWQVRARFDAGSGYRMIVGLWPKSNDSTGDGNITFASDSDAARKSLGVLLNQPGTAGANQTAGLAGDFTAWHVYTVDWRATSVKISVDATVIYDSTKQATRPVIPNKPMHLVVQVDKGPTTDIPAANSSTPAQVIEHLDWVHFSP
jgi:hypothetical protein